MQNGLLFSEQQHWDSLTWLILLVVNLIVMTAAFNSDKLSKWKSSTLVALPKTAGYAVAGVVLLGSIFFLNFRLDTNISINGIDVRFFPLQLSYRHYDWAGVDSAEVISYRPMRDFGGWGIRGNEHNRVYSMSGNAGIRLALGNGASLIIGTQQATEASKALQLAKQYHHTNN